MVETFQGALFTSDFLSGSIATLPDFTELDAAKMEALRQQLVALFAGFPTQQTPNETQTEDDLIWPVLNALGWTAHLRQQNLAAKGRDDVPDGLLFRDAAAKKQANKSAEEWRRYEHGLAIVESKRWNRPLDRRSGQRGEEVAPSSQMLRYLRRVEDLTTGKLRWGILTNGRNWRLYYQGARSVSEQFFEIDLAKVLAVPGFANEGDLFALTDEERLHAFKVFVLIFRSEAFVGSSSDPRTFHQRALQEGRFYEERVAADISSLVFSHVFPELVRAIAIAAPDAPLPDVREAALILLYRLLFILYAEDRDLLPVKDARYDDYGLRDKVRGDVGRRKDQNDVFSDTAARYWAVIDDLCRAIDKGDASIGLPPYNGGLFDAERTPLLGTIRIPDATMANVIDALSYERTDQGRRYINYRDLSVQQLGSIYERLLEHEVVREGDAVAIRPNIFARKGSGSYYTPDDLVSLIIRETLEPLIADRYDAFRDKAAEYETGEQAVGRRIGRLTNFDPAEKLLDLKICDPAMGSGHFLVTLVDTLADHVLAAMADAPAMVAWGEYQSPLGARIEAIRNKILGNAEQKGWRVEEEHLEERHIVRRMILKRCIYGVDKNPMAVELAKVSLWLHTFTVGAPLSFLDHHLRCGDSLFGLWVNKGLAQAARIENGRAGERKGASLFLTEAMSRALRSASKMQIIEGLTDAEIAEAHRSADIFVDVKESTDPLAALLSFFHALDWLELNTAANKPVLQAYLMGVFGDPVAIALGKLDPTEKEHAGDKAKEDAKAFAALLRQARALIEQEGFLHWQATYPGVWTDWEADALTGGFDAVIGNPPWDRMKLQEVEWFATRRREIAMAQRAADRNAMVKRLKEDGDPLAADYLKAAARADAGFRIARSCGDYPLLSGGDLNIYSLFVERAMQLVKPHGIVGLLTPSGIASDKTAAPFFKRVSTGGRLKALYDFENGRQSTEAPPYFPDVHRNFKFCAFVASPERGFVATRCAFFLHNVEDADNPERAFTLSAADFARVNPNTGTAPIFRTPRDASLTTAIYANSSVLVDRSSGAEVKAWPVRYMRMFDMTNDSGLFRTREELEEKEGAYALGGNRYRSAAGDWLPLYVGRMIHQFDHRSASVEVNDENLHNAAFSGAITPEQKADPAFVPTPQYWVNAGEIQFPDGQDWAIAFRDIARSVDVRTMIAAAVPRAGFGNTAPLMFLDGLANSADAAHLLGNLGAIIFDFVTRQKAQSTHLNWYIVEQLPVIPPDRYAVTNFGQKTAAEVVREAVLELTYTAHDMAPFARDMGYVDAAGEVKAPFTWDEARRLRLRAKLDAVFFHLYGVTDRDDVRYIYSTFPIVEREETQAHGRYLSRDLCLGYMSALAAGDPDAEVQP